MLEQNEAERLTLRDLQDPEVLRAWLGFSDEYLREFYPLGKHGWMYREAGVDKRTTEQLFAFWWKDYLDDLRRVWGKSKENKWRDKTYGQFLTECLSSIGVKGRTLAERVKRAIQLRPDLYLAKEE